MNRNSKNVRLKAVKILKVEENPKKRKLKL